MTTANADNFNSGVIKEGYVGKLDGTHTIVIPDDYLPTGTLGIMWHKKSILGAKQIASARIKTDSELVDGAVLMGRYIYGAFVLEAKKYGVASIVAGA